MTVRVASAAHALYKRTLSPLLHSVTGTSGACRFQPTCSEYAVLAVGKHGWLVGSGMAVLRVLRCNPLFRGGFDPVPGTWPPPDHLPVEDATDSCRVGPRQLP
ncbi:MAG TPA: membrane protein insertion efficiency factor YidD [Acidisarcina sp.]|nr:membrane protein insertion efficiency factor YidD [Acidisarcina sp.]